MGDTLALFDLDHTLLTGDSDTLWCDFLVARGLLGPDFAERNAALAAGYRAGTVGVEAFCRFYAGTLAGRAPADWAPLLQDFLAEVLRPRIPAAAQALVQQHRAQGHRLLLTSATNRVLAAPSAAELGFAELLATELAVDEAGRFTGELRGMPNMREGKVARLQAWLAGQGLAAEVALARAWFYSDSINDLPLLLAVGHPVAVDPDPRLAHEARQRGWPVLTLARDAHAP
ncbi:HAD family hydrolase [Ideonella dechloratans]|uniref:HAD family hydrolase n=1 Tax=Ideonella dechloratans TaxID=36863 RepID=A0A643FCM5_IDEDE|nr:HAD family hydrolase [Ideonella dechloratans]KAB0583247.1 HAD family hydrolase [Ideonella dechloratans]UFU10569.1 HAD-IB family hydrolase [Ideonella dechloratans]